MSKNADLIDEIRNAVSKYYDPHGLGPEEKAKKQIAYLKNLAEALQRYLPQRLIKKLSLEPEKIKVEGERRTVTILFGDLTGFTAMSETLDPEEVVQIVNEYFNRMLKVVFKYGGTIDKFMGDAIMVVFGALETHEDDATRATLAAMEMQKEMAKFNSEGNLPIPLSMSIGVNTGPVVAVNVGALERMEFTIMGDNVNLASRLEGVAEPGQVIVSQSTYEKIKNHIQTRKLPSVKVKGKRKPVLIYLALNPKEQGKLKNVVYYRTRTKLIDREEELELLKRNIDIVKNGEKRVVSIIGKSGTGKTRLLEEANRILEEQGFKTLKGDSFSYTSNIAYFPFKEMLKRLFSLKEKDTAEERRKKIRLFLVKLGLGETEVEFVSSVLDLETEQTRSVPPEVKKKYIFEALKNTFAELSKTPICLKFEDLQCSDTLSVEFITFLILNISDAKMLVLCSYRPEFAFPLIAKEYSENINLKNLEKKYTTQYLKAIFDEKEPSDEIKELVFKHTKGNPLYIEELAKNLAKRRLLKKRKVKIEFRKSPDAIKVPETINSIIMERMDRMSAMNQRVLRMASVVGQTFTLQDISFLLGKAENEIVENLESLEHFEGEIDSTPEEEYQAYHFKTPTVREVIYDAMLKKTRRELHTKYGSWIHEHNAKNLQPVLEILAYHFLNGEDIEKAILFSKLSGEKARNYFANNSGIKYFNDTLRLLKKTPVTKETEKMKLECLRRQGYFLMMTGDMKNALSNQKKALRLANKLSSVKDRIMSLLNIGMLYDKMGEKGKPMRYYRKARTAARKIAFLPLLAMSENNIGLHQKISGEFKKALNTFRRSRKIARMLKSPVEEAIAIQNMGEVQDLMGFPDRALSQYTKAMKIFKTMDVKERIAPLYASISTVYSILGQLEKAKTYADKTLEISREIGDIKTEKDGLGNLGILFFRMNQPAKAIELYNQALTMAEKMNDFEHQMALFINIGEVFHTVGDFENGVEYHKKAREIAEKIGLLVGMLEATKWLGMDYYYLGKEEDALRNFRMVFERSLKMKDKKFSSLSETLMGFIDPNVNMENASLRLKNALDVSRQTGDVDMALTLFKEAARYFIREKDFETALPNASMVLKFSEQLGSEREKAWALYLISESNKGLENAEWKKQLDGAKEIASSIEDKYLTSLINSSYDNRKIK